VRQETKDGDVIWFMHTQLRSVGLAKEAGVKQVALPHVGKPPPGRRAEERGRRFKRGYGFRAGIEGRIHSLRRNYGLKRCRYQGKEGTSRWVCWGILAHNLTRVAGSARG